METSYTQENEQTITFLPWKKLDPRLEIGFTTRNGGSSSKPYDSLNMGFHVEDDGQTVRYNRQQVAEIVKFPLQSWVCGEQIHSNQISIVRASDKGKGATEMGSAIKGVDGLLTEERGILCTAFFADCVPLFFFDPNASLIGIGHAGWKGTVAHIGPEMASQMIELGSSIEHIRVLIGPSISQKNYEVDDHVIQHIPTDLQEKVVKNSTPGRYLIDLHRLNKEILLQYGILRHNIDSMEVCTFDREDMFYSHRRDQGKTGRMLGYIGLQED
ncbi:MAG TPA: peptidoglycan editing factor PgeF [Bacillota bacterium]|nr:peptidoglycan editing factor PgeF [Bacillota bacterium]